MELRHLRYFVAVAEELHFRRAADRLHVAQPAVSEQVRKLEAELGVTLFNRSHRSVNLTEAGAAMLVEARRVLCQAKVAEQVAKRTDRRAASRLRVGYAPDCLPSVVSHALRGFAAAAPGIELALHAGAMPGLVDDVRAGRLDVAAVFLPAPISGLRAAPIASEGTVAAVPLMHRFADNTELDIEQLADSTLLVMPRTVNPAFFDGVLAACRGADVSPTLHESNEARIEALLIGVALGHGIALLPASATDRYSFAGVRYVPLGAAALSHEVALVAGPDPATAVGQLVSLARNCAPAMGPEPSAVRALAA